jgi:ubiquinone/menaquinone biosynthesis C-methylase UbiE
MPSIQSGDSLYRKNATWQEDCSTVRQNDETPCFIDQRQSASAFGRQGRRCLHDAGLWQGLRWEMQYSREFTDALQFMWGDGFLSPGGPAEVAEMLEGHDIAGKRVLDIGSGLGGVDVLLVQEHGAAEVIGIDVEEQLIEAARERALRQGLHRQIRFQLVHPGPLPFPDQSFHMVFSKDAFVHIPDKPALYGEVIRVLKPGGWMVAADWLWAEGAENSAVVQAWLSRGPLKFVFTTPGEALRTMQEAGFTDVSVIDRRHLLQRSNREEIKVLQGVDRERLAALVGSEMAASRLASARGRQNALDSGDLIPSHLAARRAD